MEEENPTRNSEYLRGLQAATADGIAHVVDLLAVEESRPAPTPMALITQARLASRLGIPLDLVIRRYLAAKDLLGDFMLEEAAVIHALDTRDLRAATTVIGAAFDQTLTTVTEEYQRVARDSAPFPGRELTEQVRRLLAGELVTHGTSDLDLNGHHLGLVARSSDAKSWFRLVAAKINGRCLIVRPLPDELWVWLGTREPLDPNTIRQCLADLPPNTPVGVGEPGTGPAGWRLTHRQAKAAVTASAAAEKGIARYGDVALLVSAGQDALLATSLKTTYLSRLAHGRDQGAILRETLRAYFAADRNSSSAAAALGVTRQTVSNRLRTVEERLAQPLSDCAVLLQTALRLEELQGKAFLDKPQSP